MNIKEKIGARIKELREARGLSQKDVAYAADLDRSYIASIENGARNVSSVNIEKIAKALQVSVRTFFSDDKLFLNLIINFNINNIKELLNHSYLILTIFSQIFYIRKSLISTFFCNFKISYINSRYSK